MRKLIRSAMASLAIGLTTVAAVAQSVVISQPTGQVWKWSMPTADPGWGLSWVEPGFDDSSWASGPAPLGYEGTEGIGYNGLTINSAGGTDIGGPGTISAFFRTTFTWPHASGQVLVSSTNWVDDGVVLYINGQEVYRVDVPAGEVTWNSPVGVEDGDLSGRQAGETGFGVAWVTNGVNSMAATVRNNTSTSSDMVWAALISAAPRPAVQITNQPPNRTVVEGQTITLTVGVNDTLSSFQWFANGEPLPDGTNQTLTIVNAGPGNAGEYFVIASNPVGTDTSATANVIVNPLAITSPTTVNTNIVAGLNANLAVTVNGPASFSWTANGVPIDPLVNPSASSNILTIPNIQVSDGGQYVVTVVNDFGRSLTATYNVTVSDDTTPPVILSARGNTNGTQVTVTFDEAVFGPVTDSFTYSISSKDGSQNLGVISASVDASGRVVTLDIEPMTEGVTYRLGFNSVLGDQFNNFMDPNTTSTVLTPRLVLARNATWRYDDFGTSEPTNWHMPGFDDSAWKSGIGPIGEENSAMPWPLGTDLNPYANTRITYYFRTTLNMPVSVTNGTLLLTQEIDDSVVIYINGVEVSRSRMPAGDPGFSTQGTGSAVGEAGLEFLTINNVNLNAGANTIAAEVHQIGGTSSDVVFGLEVTAFLGDLPENPPVITREPVAVTVNERGTANFSVEIDVQSATPLSFQWFRGSNPVDGGTNATLTLTNVLPSMAGQYSVQVVNQFGSDTSVPATLTVNADTTTPSVTGIRFVDASTILLLFNENVDPITAGNVANYSVTGNSISSVTVSNNTVTLALGTALTPGTAVPISISNIEDTAETPNTLTQSTQVSLFLAIDATWKFENSGTDLGTAWVASGFDDSAWTSAQAPLGTESGFITLTNMPITSGFTTYYFRNQFSATAGSYNLSLQYLVDDGFVVYINGAEIHRFNMPTGAITHASVANAANPQGEGVWLSANVSNVTLQANNTIAVSVHQNSATSSDLVFQLGIAGTPGEVVTTRPTLSWTRSGGNIVFTWNDASFHLERTDSLTNPNWQDVTGSNNTGTTVSTATGIGFFRLSLQD